ncbi:hypothetical protein D3C80_719890 [compost metagenome]
MPWCGCLSRTSAWSPGCTCRRPSPAARAPPAPSGWPPRSIAATSASASPRLRSRPSRGNPADERLPPPPDRPPSPCRPPSAPPPPAPACRAPYEALPHTLRVHRWREQGPDRPLCHPFGRSRASHHNKRAGCRPEQARRAASSTTGADEPCTSVSSKMLPSAGAHSQAAHSGIQIA